MTMRIHFPAALAALALGGCVSLGTPAKAPALLVGLSAEHPAAPGYAMTARPAEAVLVAEPEADRALAAPRIAVRLDDTRIAYLTGAQWVERPSRQFAGLLAEVLRAHGKRLVLQEGDALPAGGTRLGGRLLAMGYDDRERAVVVRFDAIRRGPDGRLATRRFEAREGGVKPQAGPVSAALNRLANQVAGEVADWIN